MTWFYAKLKEGAHGDLSVLNSLLLGLQKQYKGDFSVEKRRHPLFSDLFDRLGYWKAYNAYVFVAMEDDVCNAQNPYTVILDTDLPTDCVLEQSSDWTDKLSAR